MLREMLIKINDDEVSIVITGDKQLLEIFLTSPDHQNLVGNIYLGKVEKVLPGMQAAFINIGIEKNSFLYVEDALSPGYSDGQLLDLQEENKKEYAISELVKSNQQVMVQVFKEPMGTKGARVTMQPSLPGRYVVLFTTGQLCCY